MAIWRNRELEDILGGQLEQGTITEAAITKLAEEIPAESEYVDYKSKGEFKKPRDNPKWNVGQERGRDVSAFANGRGGVLIYGVEEFKKISTIPERLNPFDGSEHRYELIDQFRKDVRQYTTPNPQFDMFAVDATSGGFYLVVVIPASLRAPHAVTVQSGDDRRALHYCVRASGETNTRYLSEHEIAESYQRRSRSHEERQRHNAHIWTEGVEELVVRGVPVWLALAAVPDMPTDSLLTPTALREITDWADDQYFPNSILRQGYQATDHPFPAPGKVVYTRLLVTDDGDKTPGADETYRELHADGSAFAGLMLEQRSASGRVVKLDVDLLVADVCALMIHALDWVCARAGRWGNATVTIGLATGKDPGGAPTVALKSSGGASTFGLRRADRKMPTATTVVDLSGLDTMQDKLRATYNVAAPMVQAFGVPEPDWITETGAIRTSMILRDSRSHALNWTREYGVETVK
ncbi:MULTISPECIES: AlbA family DNA-binding domain-containing protein [Nocardia]|uniref:AlbA family DNA-binding domain-containing protein n=1 Tax=Nocardia TaxID=1817 RepID=UPI000D68B68D|nr:MULTISPECIES: ATP-binding protein [Nocardia]